MPEYDFFIITVLGITTVMTAIVAVVQKDLIRSVVTFALSSLSLAALFFILASPYAGAFELTVGAGLVAVLFLVALILAGGEEEEVPA